MNKSPLNLTPMESALLESLQQSALDHDKRLIELERLLNELSTSSETDSNSDRLCLFGLVKQLDGLDDAVRDLTVQVNSYRTEAQEMRKSYDNAASQFNLMKDHYILLMKELGEIKRAAI